LGPLVLGGSCAAGGLAVSAGIEGAVDGSDGPCADVGIVGASDLAIGVAIRAMDGDVARTELRLYMFNRSPWSRIDERCLAGVSGRDAWMRAAGLQRDGSRGGYRLSVQESGWLYWRNPRVGGWRREGTSTRKLYLAPRLGTLAGALRNWVAVAARCEVPVFKVPADYPGWRRPDRVVAYLRDRDHAVQVADALGKDWACGPVDDVPFAEPLRPGVFTGLDPVRRSADAEDGASWRRWVSHLMAGTLHEAAGASVAEGIAAVRVALEARGVDPDGFAVPDSFFDAMSNLG
jgi:hypothetical protein